MKHAMAIGFAVVLLLGACGNGGSEPETTTTSSGSSTTTTGASTTDASTTSPQGTSAPTPSASPQPCAPISGGGQTYLQLTNVRTGTHAGYDRITFEFAPPKATPAPSAPPGVLPKYELMRVATVTQDGSGQPVNIAGSDLHLIVFSGASGVEIVGEQPVLTYKGPKELRPRFKILTEAERAGDFEATLSWGFGLNQPRCPKVTELQNPLRLAIDFPH